MKKFIKKFLSSNKKNFITEEFEKFKNSPEILKIFSAFSSYSGYSEIRFVGGCVRKILNKEIIDDIDLATNIYPDETISVLKMNNMSYYKSGISHGTITAIINKKKFEITSLRKDISTDGRHAVVEFTGDWWEDASRRDFTINSIYSDLDGNLYDPFNGKKDLFNGEVKFIGDPEKRITEDYLRILRYIRFYINYSKIDHDPKIKKIIRQNIAGVKKLSNERLLDELRKLLLSPRFFNLSKDTFSLEVLSLVFPELKNLPMISKLKKEIIQVFKSKNYFFLLSFLIIDESDNTEYFFYKYNISNENKKNILFLRENYKFLFDKNFFNEKNLSKIHYKYGSSFLIDLIDFKIVSSNKITSKIQKLKIFFKYKERPVFPIKAKELIDDYKFKESRELGEKLKRLERCWLDNDFKISKNEIISIIQS